VSVDADHLARSGWLCLRIEAHDLRREDVLLPAKYRTVNVFRPLMVAAVASAGSHVVRFWPLKGTQWFSIHGQTEVVILRAPERRAPVVVDYPGTVTPRPPPSA